jgi:predicted ATPase
MIGRVTDGKALPKEIVDQISDRTDGVPLFIEELTKAILESGALRDAHGLIACRPRGRWHRSAQRLADNSHMS